MLGPLLLAVTAPGDSSVHFPDEILRGDVDGGKWERLGSVVSVEVSCERVGICPRNSAMGSKRRMCDEYTCGWKTEI